jgi:peroxiredoxin
VGKPSSLPDLPAPEDDGAADDLPGRRLPPTEFPASDGGVVQVDRLPDRSVVFVYPGIGGHLGRDERLEEWTAFPGARGCTAEACGFRDEFAEFRAQDVEVLGLSGEESAQQRRHAAQLGLRYRLLSDEGFELASSLGLPTFEFHGHRYYKRLTLIVTSGRIEAAFYPVFPPEGGAAQALEWLAQHPRS